MQGPGFGGKGGERDLSAWREHHANHAAATPLEQAVSVTETTNPHRTMSYTSMQTGMGKRAIFQHGLAVLSPIGAGRVSCDSLFRYMAGSLGQTRTTNRR